MGLQIHEPKKRTGRPTRLELACALSDIYLRINSIINDINDLYTRQTISNIRERAKYEKYVQKQTQEIKNKH